MQLDFLGFSSPKSIIRIQWSLNFHRPLLLPTQQLFYSTPAPENRPRRPFASPRRASNIAPLPLLQKKRYMSSGRSPKKTPAEARPSASILLISPSNEILLLHRVESSSSFPSGYVFPGGNLSPWQDGEIPASNDPRRHQDGPAYRLGAIRECFEESGILLARRNDGSGAFLQLAEQESERARKEIHAGKLRFPDWVASQGGVVDIDSLIPFTRWITPANLPKRYTTQMYLCFLDLPKPNSSSMNSNLNLSTPSGTIIPTPTSDGGIEHTAAIFDYCSAWLAQARANKIILFPPQFYLIHLLAPFLSPPPPYRPLSVEELQKQRDAVMAFLQFSNPNALGGPSVPWSQKVIGPRGLFSRKSDGRNVLALDKPGMELEMEGSKRSGDFERVVLVRFGKDGPRDVDVRWRGEVLEEERRWKEREKEKGGNGTGSGTKL